MYRSSVLLELLFNNKDLFDDVQKAPTYENVNKLHLQLEKNKNENFQSILDVILSRLITLYNSCSGLRKNETKTEILRCANIIINGSVINKEVAYKTILLIVTKDMFQDEKYMIELPEELKIEVFKCLEAAARNTSCDAIEEFMTEDNKPLVGQCLYLCREAIDKETFIKLRKHAVSALISILHVHDKADFNDIVLRHQISKVVHVALPTVALSLIKVCKTNDTLRGPSLIEISVKALGRYMCLIMQDYEMRGNITYSNSDFVNLLADKKDADPWLSLANSQISQIITYLSVLRGSEYPEIRYELAVMSESLLEKCLVNIQPYKNFLLENLISFLDDENEDVRVVSQRGVDKISQIVFNNLLEGFSQHLSLMPRVLLTGTEDEQHSHLSLLYNYLKLISPDKVLENQFLLEKLMNVMICCCEVTFPDDLSFTTTSTTQLSDEFYQIERPWRRFKNLKSIKDFVKICHVLSDSQIAIDYLLDRVNSVEYIVLLIEILRSGKVENKSVIEDVVEEYLDDVYWSLPGDAVTCKSRANTVDKNTAKVTKYSILCTCFITELIGVSALCLSLKFQKFLLRCLHSILIRAGSENYLIKSAGLFSLQSIATAMKYSSIAHLIDENSDFLLFNIHNSLRRDDFESDGVLDILTVIFKFSKSQITLYMEDIVETTASNVSLEKFAENSTAYLKLFNLYISCFEWDTDGDFHEKVTREGLLDLCMAELEGECRDTEESCENIEDPTDDEIKDTEAPAEDPKDLPKNIQIIHKMLTTVLPFLTSSDPARVILAHEIFITGLPILKPFESHFLPIVHEMWLPFTKQFQRADCLMLQHSFRLVTLIGSLAKEFVYKRAANNVIPTVNEFLKCSSGKAVLSYTQEFKLLRDVLGNYGRLAVDLGVDEKELNDIVDVLLKYHRHSNEILAKSCEESFRVLTESDPMLIRFKLNL